ncbi:membrane-spanning 4-domains subfamily A member 15 [Tachysurus vachellii]|uniref:membrane-spanning 4-domains subfamily A member 15 n=1 Tax=Tachysurus vachellii TaxID=175792 RepID=UPI00296B556B|nr:membrane-spanning 4-domains subfamily A member 15 [Tachysurus vachellii]XP_060726332.1 membrane-spanning 4-domains subfamily A member 15 [Tachysurus vachellii]
MATSFTTDAHGVRVVTQIIPLVSPEPVQFPSEKKNNKTKVPDAPYMTRMFLKGEPVALGTVQIMIGIVMMAMGAITWFTQTLFGEIPLGLGLSFIISGSVTLGSHKGTFRPIIKSAVVVNIISVLLALSGICYFCFAFTIQPDLNSCKGSGDTYYTRYYDCQYITGKLKDIISGINGILLILSMLEVCVCTTTIVFACKANIQASGTKMEEVVQGKCSIHDALLNTEVDSPPVYEP